MKKISVESTAEAYLELLAARGVEYLFANAGTDFAPLIEAYAKRLAQGQALPRPVTVPHETPAVAMAHGYAMVTGRPQAVMVHVIVGAANALAGIINASRVGVPMLPNVAGHVETCRQILIYALLLVPASFGRAVSAATT